MKIYYNQITKNYYGINIICCSCNKKIDNEIALLSYTWFDKRKTNQKSKAQILCMQCIKKQEKRYHIQESLQILCIPKEKIPQGSIPFIHYSCSMSDGKELSIFEATKLQSEQTIDNTIYAGRDRFFNSLSGNNGTLQIGKPIHEVINECKQRELEIQKDPIKYLSEVSK